jgi:threonine/homoserine/homoserine lactone efflux protein
VTSFLFELALGLALGFSLTIPPGPMNAFIASRAVRSLGQGVASGLGAMSADAVLGGIVYLLRSEVDLTSLLRWVYLVGAVVMVVLGVGLLRRPRESAVPEVVGTRTYVTALGLGLSNPFQIVWWLTAGLAFAYLGGWVLFVGLFGAIAVWIVVFPWALHVGTRGRPRLAHAVVLVSVVLMLAFAGYFVYLAL